MTPLMEAVEAAFPGIKAFSLPSVGEGGGRRHIELGVKGPVAELDAAWQHLRAGALALGGEVSESGDVLRSGQVSRSGGVSQG